MPQPIRKDIIVLDGERKLKRTHGGALATLSPAYEIELEARRFDHAEQKQSIAGACLRLIGRNDSIYLEHKLDHYIYRLVVHKHLLGL
mgnify:CR=1 FL=1